MLAAGTAGRLSGRGRAARYPTRKNTVGRETFNTTLYAIRLWQGAELWITPEIDQGFGSRTRTASPDFRPAMSYAAGHGRIKLPR